MNALSPISVFAAGLSSWIGNILLKWSRTSLPAGAGPADKFFSIGFVAGLAFYGINVLLFAKALDTMEVSAYPVLARSGFASLAVVSHYIFGEPFHLYNWIGLALVLGGIVFLVQGD